MVRDKVEAAYARGTLFEHRRTVMEDWATYVAGRLAQSHTANVSSSSSAHGAGPAVKP